MNEQEVEQSINAAVVIPALQSLITGILWGAAAGFIAWSLAWAKPGAIGLGIAAAVMALSWHNRLGDWTRRLEGLLGLDLNRDGYIGDPQPERIQVDIIEPGLYPKGQYLDLPIGQDRLIQIAQGLEAGQNLSYASFAGRGKLLSRSEFEQLRDAWILAGLARWRHETEHNRGVTLTGKGRAVARGFASMADTLPLQLKERA